MQRFENLIIETQTQSRNVLPYLTISIETISQAEWARRNGVSTKSVAMLLNHSKRKAEGKDCISKNGLRNIAQHLSLITEREIKNVAI
jgi:hypothetical protein